MTLVKLGIVQVGKMYIQSEGIPSSHFNKRTVTYSTVITDAHLYKQPVAGEVAEKYGGRAIPISLNIPEANS